MREQPAFTDADFGNGAQRRAVQPVEKLQAHFTVIGPGRNQLLLCPEPRHVSLEKNLRVLLALLLYTRNTLGALNRERLCI